jgi:hypothetical protein
MAAVDLIMQYDPRQTGSPPKPIEPTGFFTGIQFRPILTGAVVTLAFRTHRHYEQTGRDLGPR